MSTTLLLEQVAPAPVAAPQTAVVGDDSETIELINGIAFQMPSPNIKHQRINAYIFGQLMAHLAKNPIGEVLMSPLDVVLDPNIHSVQPDLIYFHKRPIDANGRINFAPEILMEVVSETSLNRDSLTKKALYEQYGVQEFWLIIPAINLVEVFTLKEGRYQRLCFALDEGEVFSAVLDGFRFEAKLLFEYGG